MAKHPNWRQIAVRWQDGKNRLRRTSRVMGDGDFDLLLVMFYYLIVELTSGGKITVLSRRRRGAMLLKMVPRFAQ